MNTRTSSLAVLAAIAGTIVHEGTTTYRVRAPRHEWDPFSMTSLEIVHTGSRRTTPTKSRQVKVKLRKKGRHCR